jgi:hypothetical protein
MMITQIRQATLDEAITAVSARQDTGAAVDEATFVSGSSDLANEIRAYFANLGKPSPCSDEGPVTSEHCEWHPQGSDRFAGQLRKGPTPAAGATQALYIGRYQVERLLGLGGFGAVYLAYDGQLRRRVAIKVPYQQNVSSREQTDAYLTEARTVAGLEHPHTVPVYDGGHTSNYTSVICAPVY